MNSLSRILVHYLGGLCERPSPSGSEQEVTKYCAEVLHGFGFKTRTRMAPGGLLAIRGEPRILLNAHLDTVQSPEDVRLIKERPEIITCYNAQRSGPHGRHLFHAPGLQMGGDDKAGIALILALAEWKDYPLAVLLTEREETGQEGAQLFCARQAEFLASLDFCLTFDRKGNDELCRTYANRCQAPAAFVLALKLIAEEQGFTLKSMPGPSADIQFLAEHVPGVNLSAGFYNAHGPDDYVVVEDTERMLCFADRVIRQQDDLRGIARWK